MTVRSDNCSICAEEYTDDELHTVALSAINVTRFKICSNCLSSTDPECDYKAVRDMVSGFVTADKKLK